MTEDVGKLLLEIRDRTIRMEEQLKDRDRQISALAANQAGLHGRVSELELMYAGLKAWIAAAGLIGGIFGWLSHSFLPALRK
ncbi:MULTISPECIES: hypothetical protein [Aminobacterium]|jgi:hypothetical protein|uniref:hypothetical protein n=1 Tax=Aminobacterium TaxID=81466 RepID=UPI00257BFAD3|nr:hypothetical protein [Aminobacterium sp. UBA4987]